MFFCARVLTNMNPDNKEDFLLKLTLAVYRVTDLFPEKEPLRYSLREAANEILASWSAKETEAAGRNFALLKSYFAIAKSCLWVKEANFCVLEREYEAFINGSAGSPQDGDGGVGKDASVNFNTDKSNNSIRLKRKKTAEKPYSPDERKQKIAGIIIQQNKITLKDILGQLPEINRRTLIRDLDGLLKKDIIKKAGNGRAAFYAPNGRSEIVPPIVTEEMSLPS